MRRPSASVPVWRRPTRRPDPATWPGPGWVQQPHRPDIPWQDRGGYDRAVRDHRPFQYQGKWVNPVFDNGHQGWGFWLGPIWIPLL